MHSTTAAPSLTKRRFADRMTTLKSTMEPREEGHGIPADVDVQGQTAGRWIVLGQLADAVRTQGLEYADAGRLVCEVGREPWMAESVARNAPKINWDD